VVIGWRTPLPPEQSQARLYITSTYCRPSRELVCLLLPSHMRNLDFEHDNRLVEVQNDDREKEDETYQVSNTDRRVHGRAGRRMHDDRQFPDGTFELDASGVFARARAACARSPTGLVRRPRADHDQPQPRSV